MYLRGFKDSIVCISVYNTMESCDGIKFIQDTFRIVSLECKQFKQCNALVYIINQLHAKVGNAS